MLEKACLFYNNARLLPPACRSTPASVSPSMKSITRYELPCSLACVLECRGRQDSGRILYRSEQTITGLQPDLNHIELIFPACEPYATSSDTFIHFNW